MCSLQKPWFSFRSQGKQTIFHKELGLELGLKLWLEFKRKSQNDLVFLF